MAEGVNPMDIFDLVFTPLMILFPAAFTLFIRPGEALDDERRALAVSLVRRLWLATAVALTAFVGLTYWRPVVGHFMWLAFFPLWFLFAMPLLRTRNPEWGPVARGSVRSASLASRDRLPPELRVGWIAVTALWLLVFAVTVAGLFVASAQAGHWWLLAFNAIAGAELWILNWAMRRSLIEAEPVSPADDEAIRAERESFRRFKLYGWLAVAALVMLIFSLPPLLLVWYGVDALTWAIIIGAGGGALVGIGGGVFGTIASLKRAKINRLALEARAHD